MTPDMLPSETYAGTIATLALVGRKTQLAEIDHAVRDTSHSYVIQISGSGGIGKTRLVGEVLRRYQKESAVAVARQMVDLYHITVHSVEGLMVAIQEAVSPKGVGFGAYQKARSQLDRYLAEPTGESARLHQLREQLQRDFIADLNRLGESRRLILVLDTAEKLVYEIGEAEQRLGLTQERIITWKWLRDLFLPGVQNAVVIIAGRPQIDRLADDLRGITGKEYISLPLGPLSESEAMEYFDAVVKMAKQQRDLSTAERVRVLPESTRRTIVQKTDGRPILLSLIIDYLTISGHVPPNLESFDMDALERELVQAIQETNRPVDEAICALAWARKGMNAELLARVADLRTGDGSWDVIQARQWLEKTTGLSFVKVHPANERIFLHDEMYDLLERHVLRPRQNPKRAERAYGAILGYYQRQIEQAREGLAVAYQVLENAGEEAVHAVVKATEHLHELLVEDLHYQLRANANEGFEIYYRYAEEAALGENESLDAQLRAELLAFLAERDPEGTQPEIDGLARTVVNADGAIRWVKRRIAAGQYPAAADLATTIRKSELLPPGDQLAEAELASWEALAQLYGSLMKPGTIEQTLVRTAQTLERLPATPRRNAVLARTYNNLGYLQRLEGRYGGAIQSYWKAIPRWRAVKIAAEQANTLNNLAFARSEMGDFGTARRQAIDALELRQASGARPQIGLSLSTIAQIAIREGLYITAQRRAEQALALFEATQDARGRGLALAALAEAKRRWATEGPCPDAEAEELLWQAISQAQEGCNALEAIKEPSRYVGALIQLGCAYRDLMGLRRHYPGKISQKETVESLASQSQQVFEKAQHLAEEQKLLYLQVDACNRKAWLHYYREIYYRRDTKQPLQAKEAHTQIGESLREVINLIPSYCHITTEWGVPPLDPDRVIIPLLAQMGKARLLQGQIAFNEFEAHHDRKALQQAIEHYTLALAYDNMVSLAQFRDKRRAKDRIYNRLRKLNTDEMLTVYQEVGEIESRYRLGDREMRRFLEDNFGPSELLRTIKT